MSENIWFHMSQSDKRSFRANYSKIQQQYWKVCFWMWDGVLTNWCDLCRMNWIRSLDDLQDKTNLEFHIFQEIRLNSLTRHFVCLNRFFKVLCSTVLHCFLFLLIPDNIRFLFIIITFCCVLTWDENRSSLLLFRRLFHLPVLNNSFFPFYSDLLFRPRE